MLARCFRKGELDLVEGLVGDTWSRRGSSRSADGRAHPEMQLNVMNVRAAALVAQHPDRWALAGDQLYVDLDLSGENLPAGTRLAIGDGRDRSHAGAAHGMQQVRRTASGSTR